MNESLKQLYNKLILDRQTDPIGFQKRENARQVLDAYNPVCGDHFKLYLDFKGPTITEATFHGYGCALSKASITQLFKDVPILKYSAWWNVDKLARCRGLALYRLSPSDPRCFTMFHFAHNLFDLFALNFHFSK